MVGRRDVSRDPFSGVQIRVGVMGSASEPVDQAVAALCRRLGRAVEVLYEGEPARLVDRLLDRYRSPDYVCPCRPGGRRSTDAAS